MKLASLGLLLLCVLVMGCGQASSVPSTHKYEPFGKYVLEIETVGSYSFKTSFESRQSGDEITQRAEYQWGNYKLNFDNGKLTFNGKDAGTLQPGDRIQIDAKGRIMVNGIMPP